MKCAAAHLRDLPREAGRLAGTFNAMLNLPLLATIKAVEDLPCWASIRGTLGLETLWRGAVLSRQQ